MYKYISIENKEIDNDMIIFNKFKNRKLKKINNFIRMYLDNDPNLKLEKRNNYYINIISKDTIIKTNINYKNLDSCYDKYFLKYVKYDGICYYNDDLIKANRYDIECNFITYNKKIVDSYLSFNYNDKKYYIIKDNNKFYLKLDNKIIIKYDYYKKKNYFKEDSFILKTDNIYLKKMNKYNKSLKLDNIINENYNIQDLNFDKFKNLKVYKDSNKINENENLENNKSFFNNPKYINRYKIIFKNIDITENIISSSINYTREECIYYYKNKLIFGIISNNEYSKYKGFKSFKIYDQNEDFLEILCLLLIAEFLRLKL